MNIALILECLRRDAPLSRAELAQITSLNKATVSSLVKELLDSNFVRETGIDSGDKGRPSIQLNLNPEAGCIIGAEIGVDFISVILTNFSAEVLWRRKESTTPLQGQEPILNRLVELLQEACLQAQAMGLRLLGIGLGVAGLVDSISGTLLFAPNLKWTNVPLRARLQRKFQVTVYVNNEATMAALGESYFGAARGSDFVLYVSSGVGLGGGIVLNRQVLPGASGFAGEVGHMTMDPHGPRCNCGNFGCWETFVSQWAVFRRIREAVEAGKISSLVAMTQGNLDSLSFPIVIEAARTGDVVALSALEETGRYLGIGLANLINALNPQRVVFGGILSLGHEYLLPVIQEVVQQRALRWSRESAEIVIAAYGQDACVMGGVATVFHHVLAQPLEVTLASASI
jgi:glucokinase-like ROK family protein